MPLIPSISEKGLTLWPTSAETASREDPLSGALFVFRNRSGTALKLLVYDGSGYWLCLKRFSQGKLRWWPASHTDPLHPLAAHQLSVLLYHGHPELARFAESWHKLA